MRILIADDESIIRMGLKAMLKDLGHEVITAADGHEVLTQARLHDPDLAILDIKMPFASGLEAARALGRTRPIPILILTAFSDKDLIEAAAELPIHGYLIKPILAEELAAAIAVAVKRFDEAQTLQARTSELEAALETRKLVERAKGKLMAQGVSEADAYRHLQTRARQRRITMRDVALSILRDEE